MAKGMTNSVIALIGISVLVTALMLSRPFELENQKAPIYSFIEKTDYKKQVVWFTAGQAVMEAFADHALAQTSTGNCDALSQNLDGELDTQTTTYLNRINDPNYFPENKQCKVNFLGSRLDQPANGGLEQYNVAVEITCTSGAAQDRVFVEVKKNQDFNMLRLDTPDNDPCTVTIRDLDSGTEFTQ